MNKQGRKNLLTEQMQKKITRLIHSIEITEARISWEFLKDEVHRNYGLTITRQTLASNTKIAEAYKSAKEYQSKLKEQYKQLPFKTLPRNALREKVIEMQARINTLEAELATVRAHQYDQMSAFLTTRCVLQEKSH